MRNVGWLAWALGGLILVGCTPLQFADAGDGADGGRLDAGEDAASPDAGQTDAGQTDAGQTDAGQTDAGPTDAGPLPDSGIDGGPIELDCLDGADNDGDGLIDCADPDCDPIVQCVPAPEDWMGPGVARVGAPGGAATCTENYPSAAFAGHREPQGDPATCRSCACGDPTFTGCLSGLYAAEYSSASCPAGVPTASVSMDNPGCYNSPQSLASFRLRDGFAPRGTCALTQNTLATKGPTSWATVGRLCEPAAFGGGCSEGHVCAPRPAGALEGAALCVAQAGDTVCPSGYERRQLLYGSVDDRRDCTACSCTYGASGCVGDVEVYTGSNCTGSLMPTPPIGSCRTGNPGSYRMSNLRATGETCSASGGAPTGCLRGAEPTTVCCQPESPVAACPNGPGPAMVEIDDGAGNFYCIDSTEVTNADYEVFLADAPSTASQPDHCLFNEDFTPTSQWPATNPDAPVVYVDYCDALAYCTWAGKTLCGRVGGGTLNEVDAVSSLGQWFGACTNGGTDPVPYGAAANTALCPVPNTSLGDATLESVRDRACCSGPEPGLYGLMTNAQEWIDACSGTAGATDTCRVMGGYSHDLEGTRRTCAEAALSHPRSTTSDTIGFRCCAL